MTPPPVHNGNPTTGEIAVSLSFQQDRLEKAEDKISDIRTVISKVEQMIITMNNNLDFRLIQIERRKAWLEKLAFAGVVGVAGLIGKAAWDTLTRTVP